MRNLLSHEYWRTNPDDVWSTVVNDVPEAAGRAQHVLGSEE